MQHVREHNADDGLPVECAIVNLLVLIVMEQKRRDLTKNNKSQKTSGT